MATRFPFVPDWTAKVEEAPRVRRVSFGDGYEQRSADGINAVLQKWAVSFVGKTKADAEAIAAFLKAQGGTTAFDFAYPGKSWSANGSGFGLGTGSRTQFQLQYPALATRNQDWRGAWPVYSTPRTNLALKTEDLTNGVWAKAAGGFGSTPTVTANAGVAPDGTATADLVLFDAGAAPSSLSDFSRVANTLSAAVRSGQSFTSSVWMRTFDGSTKLVSLANATGVSNPVTVTADWQRFSVTTTLAADATVAVVVSLIGTGTAAAAAVLVWGAQAEVGASATRYESNSSASAPLTVSPSYYPATDDGFAPASAWLSRPVVAGASFWHAPVTYSENLRTNYVVQSQTINNGWISSGVSTFADDAAAPDGTTTADKGKVNSATSSHHYTQTLAGPPPGSLPSVFSVWARKGTDGGNYNWMWLQLSYTGGSSTVGFFNLSNGATGTVVAGSGASVSLATTAYPLVGGVVWYRCELRLTLPRSAVPVSAVWMGVSNADNVTSFAGDNASFHWFWGAQLETGATAGLYIPTVASVVSAADYSLAANGVVTFSTAPPSGAVLTFTGSGEDVKRVKCSEWSTGLDGYNGYRVDARFEEVMA